MVLMRSRPNVMETRLDTAKGDGVSEGEDDVGEGETHDVDTKSNV